MKLYPKNLSSLEALKREKIRLRYERRQTTASDLNPLAQAGRSKISASAKTGVMSTAMELAGAKSNLQLAMAIGKPLLRMLRKRNARKREQYFAVAPGRKKKPSAVRRVLTDIAVSYAMGKGLQMAVNGIRLLLRRRKAARIAHRLGHVKRK